MSSIELDDVVLAHTSDKVIQNIGSLIISEKSIQRIRFTLVMCVGLAMC